jgi:gluconolactonase
MNYPKIVSRFAALALALVFAEAGFAADTYPLGPDSQVQPGVPQGELITYEFASAKIFPGTTREVTLYIPKQYDPAKPACVHVNQDGVQFRAPTVFDNLIAKGEMPVTIGVFVRPGVVKPLDSESALGRVNRSFEYDSLGDAYVRFLLEELLPDVATRKTADGRAIRLSDSRNDRAIAGTSSGAIAAFTAAWERPDAFTRVFSGIGTYTGLRGGHNYITLVRKYEPKPIRIFLQDGSGDLNNSFGDWWMANQTMERAFAFAGYEVNHAWGTGGHNGEQSTAVFPDAIRWLWRGWPEPVKGSPTQNPVLNAILIPGEEWELVGEDYRLSEGPAINTRGEVFFTDIPNNKAYKLDANGKPQVFIDGTKRANGQAFGPDGKLYSAASGANQIIVYDGEGKGTVFADGFSANDLVVAHNGNVYATNPGNGENKVWLVRPDGSKVVVDEGLRYPNGIALSPDQSLLYVADYLSHWVYSYQIQADGKLAHKQRYFWLHSPDTEDHSFADGIKCDREGRLYVATRLGIQVCDQGGRVQAIIPTPNRKITNLTFVGENLDTLLATCNEQVFKRKVKVRGVNAWAPPFKAEVPR